MAFWGSPLPLSAIASLGRGLTHRRLVLGFGITSVLRCFATDLPLTEWQGETMGSTSTVKIAGTNLVSPQLDALKRAVESRLKEVNRQMSHYQPDSELSRFNRAPAQEPFPISADFARVLRIAVDLDRQSGGAFDPILGPVINLWGFGEASSLRRTPDENQLREALAQTGLNHLRLTNETELVKAIPGLQLNFSALAKGFGVDAMAEAVRARGYTNSVSLMNAYCFIGYAVYTMMT